MQITDFLIIGQGIAGSVLAFKLKKRGFRVRIVDMINPNSSSRVAAGIWHPMVFKRLSQTWLADKFIPAAEKTYLSIERESNSQFFHQGKYSRLLTSVSECNDWDTLSSDGRLANWMGEVTQITNPSVCDFEGQAHVHHAGYLDTSEFLSATRNWLSDDLLDEEYYDDRLELLDSGVVYHSDYYEDIKAQKIVFANGLKARESSWFNWVPFAPVKGEVITVFSPQLKLEEIISKGVFICPIGNHRYNVGATYHWDKLDDIPTEEGASELTRRLQEIIKVPFDIVDHRAGIRPAVKGRRPLLGNHPKEEKVTLFNGMGSKAVLMVPYLADHFIDYLINGSTLMEDVDLARFYSFHS